MSYTNTFSMHIQPAQTKFPGVPLSYYEESGYYGITHMQMQYFMPESVAALLADYWKSTRESLTILSDWFTQLSEEDKKLVVRFDINSQSYL
jgi:hypothetical protein